MKVRRLHPWDVSPAEARAIQDRLRHRVVRRGPTHHVRWVAGLDVSYSRGSDLFWAAAVLLRLPGLEVAEEAHACARVSFPYVPGYLSFRELPVAILAFERLRGQPDAVLCDAHGLAHPRAFGLACHLGLLLGIPTLGCAKSRLVGEHDEPGPARGDHAPLRFGDRVVGSVLRTRPGVRPIYVSVGHRVGLAPARRLVLRCGDGYRLPAPTRLAHLAVNRARREGEGC